MGGTHRRAALTMRVTEANGYDEPRDSVSHDWWRVLAHWGMAPLPVPNFLNDPVAYVDDTKVALLVLTGGDDPGDPQERHATEMALLDYAIERRLAVLGVCRGAQVINLYFGGRLCGIDDHVGAPHPVEISTPFIEAYGKTERVNSFHRLGIAPEGLAGTLNDFARDASGRIEGFHHSNLPIVGLMWHPERKGAPPGDAALISHLLSDGAFWQ